MKNAPVPRGTAAFGNAPGRAKKMMPPCIPRFASASFFSMRGMPFPHPPLANVRKAVRSAVSELYLKSADARTPVNNNSRGGG